MEISNRLTPDEVVISLVTEDDLKSIAEGYYAAFPPAWHDLMEPPEGRPPLDTRVQRFAERMRPWLTASEGRYMKATLSSDPKHVIGHAGWLAPRSEHVLHHWRSDAAEKHGWREQQGWSKQYEDELWSHVDKVGWQKVFAGYDDIRKEEMKEEPHWFLAPLWAHPDFQGRGVSSLLLKDVLDLADVHDPPVPIYLEAIPDARPIYQHFNFIGLVGENRKDQMIRRGGSKTTKLLD